MTDQEILRDQTVIIEDGLIAAIGPSPTTAVPRSAVRVDGKGRFLIPGLADMHVHIDHPSELELYPAYGVTTVLNMRGLPKHLRWRDEIARGALFRPTLLTTGDYMDGYPPVMQPMMSFDSPEDAAASVVRQRQAGYDFVKVYTQLSAEQFRAIGRQARELGIAVVGHGSDNYSLDELMAWQVNIAHSEELIQRYLDRERPEESLDEIVRTLRPGNTTVTANLNFSRSLIRQKEDLESLLALPESRTLHPAVFQPFRRVNNRYARRDEDWLTRVRELFRLQQRLARKLADAGVVLLAGTDASTAGVYPGYSLYEELEELVAAGLTPLQALGAATREPGRFVARHAPSRGPGFGQIEEGLRADLALLERNPLDDIRNVSSLAGVVLRGTWHPVEEIRQRLALQAASFEPLRGKVIELEGLITAGRIEDARALFDAERRRDPQAVLFSQYVPFFVGYRFLYGSGGFNPDPRKLEVALEVYKMYAETYPEFHSAHYQLALAYQANGRVEEAIGELEQALALHPFYPDARLLLRELAATPASQPAPAAVGR
jgi:imidazolonepropionase-like amidohydrolase